MPTSWGSSTSNDADGLVAERLAKPETPEYDPYLALTTLLDSSIPFDYHDFSHDPLAYPGSNWDSNGLPDPRLPAQSPLNWRTDTHTTLSTVLSAACQRCCLLRTPCDLVSPQYGPCRMKDLSYRYADEVYSNPLYYLGKVLTCVQRWSPPRG